MIYESVIHALDWQDSNLLCAAYCGERVPRGECAIEASHVSNTRPFHFIEYTQNDLTCLDCIAEWVAIELAHGRDHGLEG